MDYQWIKIKSWHAVATPTRVSRTYQTVCGKQAAGDPVDDLPGTEKSCERCLQIVQRRTEAAATQQALIDSATEAGVAAGVGAVPVDTSEAQEPITAGQAFQPTLTPTTEKPE